MNQSFSIGRLFGLKIRVRPMAFIAAMLLWALFSSLGIKQFRVSPRKAMVGGLTAVLLHYLSDLWHHLGHARAAEITGFPMEGVDFWGPLGTSYYPADEPPLAADIHIQRALGGPIASVLLSVAAGLIWLLLRPLGDVYALVAAFTFIDNSLFLTLGAFLPLGFTDGSTILRWWPQRNKPQLTINQ